MRSGKWKLHFKESIYYRKRPKPERPWTMELYDLAADVSEKDNLAARHPEVVGRLKALAEALDKEIAKNRRPVGTLPAKKNA